MTEEKTKGNIIPDWDEDYRGARVEVVDVHAFNGYLQEFGVFNFLYGEPTIVLECYGEVLKMALELQINELSDGGFNKLVNHFDLRGDDIGSIDISGLIGKTITVSTYNNYQNARVSVGRPKEEDSGWKLRDIETIESMLNHNSSIAKGYEARDLGWLSRFLEIQDHRHQKETTNGWLPVNVSYSSTAFSFVVEAKLTEEISLGKWIFHSENKQGTNRVSVFKDYFTDESGSFREKLYIKPIWSLSPHEVPTPKTRFFLSENESWVLTHKPTESESLMDKLKDTIGINIFFDDSPSPDIYPGESLRRAKTSQKFLDKPLF